MVKHGFIIIISPSQSLYSGNMGIIPHSSYDLVLIILMFALQKWYHLNFCFSCGGNSIVYLDFFFHFDISLSVKFFGILPISHSYMTSTIYLYINTSPFLYTYILLPDDNNSRTNEKDVYGKSGICITCTFYLSLV